MEFNCVSKTKKQMLPGYVMSAPNHRIKELNGCDCRDWNIADFLFRDCPSVSNKFEKRGNIFSVINLFEQIGYILYTWPPLP